jgi:hypothetical protein
MTYRGTVKNGNVVFEPNGDELTDNLPGASPADLVRDLGGTFAVYKKIDVSKYVVDTGIPDLATNLDYYLYGHPKVSDGQ